MYLTMSQLTDFISRISAAPKIGTVSNPQNITCLVISTIGLNSGSVTSFWTGPSGVVTNNERVTIDVIVDDSIYITILHFDYIWESDEGIYTCNVTTGDHTVSLNANLTNLISKLSI